MSSSISSCQWRLTSWQLTRSLVSRLEKIFTSSSSGRVVIFLLAKFACTSLGSVSSGLEGRKLFFDGCSTCTVHPPNVSNGLSGTSDNVDVGLLQLSGQQVRASNENFPETASAAYRKSACVPSMLFNRRSGSPLTYLIEHYWEGQHFNLPKPQFIALYQMPKTA